MGTERRCELYSGLKCEGIPIRVPTGGRNTRKRPSRALSTILATMMLLMVGLGSLPPSAAAQTLQEWKLTASDQAFNDEFGVSVDVDGEYAVVGAFGDDDKGNASGSAYVFKWAGSGWTQQAKLTANDGAAGDSFGEAVSISGDYLVVGAYRDDDRGTNSGSSYVFHRSGTTWTQQAKLTAVDGAAEDGFGEAVSISGDCVIVGAPGDDDGATNSGSSYIFSRSGVTWTQQAKLPAGDPTLDGGFGLAVGIAGDYAVVGAWQNYVQGTMTGSAYVFHWSGSSWTQQSRLTAADGAADDSFGMSVSISGDYVAVGAPFHDDNGSASGSAYVFMRDGTTWPQVDKLLASDGTGGDRFGSSVSISAGRVVVGAYNDDASGTHSGSAYLFVQDGAQWSEIERMIPSDVGAEDRFGCSVGITSRFLIAGSYFDYSPVTTAGSAYIYELPQTGINLTVNQVIREDDCETVKVIATVTDDQQDPVTGLGLSNFSLTEDGAPRTIRSVETAGGSSSAITFAMSLDYSGSMSSSSIASMETAANQFVDYMESGDQGTIVKFSSAYEVVQSFTSEKSLLHDAINATWPDAGHLTSLYDAIYLSLQELSTRSGRRAAVVLTDGTDSGSTHTSSQVIDYAQHLGVPVFTIGLGTNINETVLTGIAQGTGGLYYPAPTADDLEEIYARIRDALDNQYIVTYQTNMLDGDEHTVDLTVDNGETDSDSGTFTACSQNCVALPTMGFYGHRMPSGDNGYADKACFSFAAPPSVPDGQVLVLRYRVYDMDFADEVMINLNDQFVGYAPLSANNGYSGEITLELPEGLVEPGTENVIEFDNTYNPPKSFVWGVGDVRVEIAPDCDLELPAEGFYGNKVPGYTNEYKAGVRFCFDGPSSGPVILLFQVYDVDFDDEVVVDFQGEQSFEIFAPKTANNGFSGWLGVFLPASYIKAGVPNSVAFRDNLSGTYVWGVGKVYAVPVLWWLTSAASVSESNLKLDAGELLLNTRWLGLR